MFKNFKTRLLVSLALLVVAAVGLPLFDGFLFRLVFYFYVLMAELELISFLKRKAHFENYLLVVLMTAFIICSAIYVATTSVVKITTFVFSACAYDVFAYLFGNLIGGKIFKKSRPFPYISKNKTWEGTIMGLVCSFVIVCFNLFVFNMFDYIFFLCGPLALIGDLFESFLKRRFAVKDSNEIIIKNKFFQKAEFFVGGSAGHGGFLDRMDSVSFVATVLWLCSIL